MTRPLVRLALGAALGLLAAPGPALALLGSTPTIRAVAVGRNPIIDGGLCPIMIGQNADGSYSLIVRTIDKATGLKIFPDLVADLPAGVTPVDVMFSNIVMPGSILVLSDDLRVHNFPLTFDADGRPKFAGPPTIHGPFGDLAEVGAATAFAEAPGGTSTLGPFLGIGTSGGRLGIGIIVAGECPFVDLGKGAITGLATVPQVGYFAFVAAHNGRAVGVNPGSSPPAVVFDLADPRPHPFLGIGSATGGAGAAPTTAAPVSFVAANGTRDVAVLQIPASPTIGGTLTVGIIIGGQCPIVDVALGSLLMLDADGDAVTLDPGFTLEGGPSGRILTAFGAAVDLSPDTLNLGSKGQYVTALLEVEDGGAAAIDTGTLSLHFGSASVPASASFAPQTGDADEDGQADVLAKFDRAEVEGMLAGAAEGPVTLTVTWTGGSASGQIRIKH